MRRAPSLVPILGSLALLTATTACGDQTPPPQARAAPTPAAPDPLLVQGASLAATLRHFGSSNSAANCDGGFTGLVMDGLDQERNRAQVVAFCAATP